MAETATLILGDQKIELPVVEGSEGEKGIDIRTLRAKTGYITYDPGYGNTGSCESAITFINGEKGILRYRGIPIEQFEKTPNFVEVCWLLIFGSLPTREQLERFSELLTKNAHLNEDLRHHFKGFPRNAPPMAILSAMINAASCFHPEEYIYPDETSSYIDAAARLISKIRTIAAYSHRSSKGLPFMYPNPRLSYCANFLHMMFSMPHDSYEVDPEVEKALNLILILHADHEQNCSTSTVRMVGSSLANLFTSCSAGVAALWGPLHGGANVAVLEMLEQIRKGSLTPEEYLKLSKEKDNNIRLMGFGHRVYKNFDPRALILKKSCDQILAKMGKRKDPLLDIAQKLEELALKDSYFVERKLYPNVDFYSGIIMRAIGIPINMFTVIFSIGRLPGWIAQWKEHKETVGKISRPRQIYIGNQKNDYIPLDQRG